jgi:hypothetical protein
MEGYRTGMSMQCYFNLVSADQIITDYEGLDVADPDEAHTEVLKAAAEIIQDGETGLTDWRGWHVEATDASGAVLFTIRLDDLAG